MNVCLLLIGDGRHAYRARTLRSAAHALPAVDHTIEIDDRHHRLGFAGAIQAGWDQALQTDAEWIFHLELDFTFRAPVPLQRMIDVLWDQPHLAQMVLKRQPWNESEKAACGIVEQHPDDYTEVSDGISTWTEHRRFFSTNPCVYHRRLAERGWPQAPRSEGIFTHLLLENPDVRFAFWGGKHAEPVVDHIGERRAGCGY